LLSQLFKFLAGIRLVQVLLHAGTTAGGWRAQQLHDAVVASFGPSAKRYGLNQLRYDLRKLRAPPCSKVRAPATPIASPTRA